MVDTLIAKFENDIEKHSYAIRLLLAVDQFFNVLVWNGSQDETISSNIGRKIHDGTANIVEVYICKFLQKFEYGHCKESIGE